MAAVRLGVLGGTFDPPHVAHLVLADQAREQLQLDTVLWVPAGDPWRKSDRDVTTAEHRLAMVRLATQGSAVFEVSLLEVLQKGPSYTVDTLAALSEERRPRELYCILGDDALDDLPNWHEPERLISLATLAVAARRGGPRSAAALDAILPGLGAAVVWLVMPRLDVSSTDLRRRALEGRSVRYLVPPPVADYIREHRLYRRD
jgi:nicotinate-nucleotide adenylyltransferase